MKIDSNNFFVAYHVKQGHIVEFERFNYRPFKNCQVHYLTSTIIEVILENRNTLMEGVKQLASCKGILLFGKNEQIFYDFDKDKNSMRVFYYIGEILEFVYDVVIDPNAGEYGGVTLNMVARDKKYEERLPSEDELALLVNLAIMFEIMKQFDALHFEIISGNTKQGFKPTKIVNGETYRTEGITVRIVDCKYVRTLIRSGQFKVKGFFRWQPYGSRDNTSYKLIWIDEHLREKHNILKKEL